MEPQIRFCTSADGTRIAYATLGEGPPLVHVPGWGTNLELFWQHPNGRAFMERLAQGRLYVSLNRRGMSASQRDVTDVSLEPQITDVTAVVDHLGLERFDLFGNIDGAAVAVAYAVRHPGRVSRLVLFAPYPSGVEIAAPGTATLAELMRENWSLARRAICGALFPTGPTELQRWFSDTLRQSLSPEVAAKYLEFEYTVDVTAYLPQVGVPALVLSRRDNRVVPISAARAAAALLPDARFVALEGNISHPYFGDISYVDTIREFLDEGRARTTREVPAPAAVHTILFTDIEGSTALTQRLGDARAQEVLDTHNRIVREALAAHGGSEIKHTGDGIMASFPLASSALECAISIQRAVAEWNRSLPARPEALEGRAEPEPPAHPSTGSGRAGAGASAPPEPIVIRIGLNAGEPVAKEQDLFGTAVQLARRVCDHAEPGQILASDVVRGLAAGKGFLFSDSREVVLKGFEEPVRLYEVSWRPFDSPASAGGSG